MKKIISIILFLSLLVCTTLYTSNVVYAAETSIDMNINSIALYEATNNYSYINDFEANEHRYNLNDKNENIEISTDKPLMTVFTHGLAGDASHWSNSAGQFAYSDKSLITRLAKLIDSNIYWVRFISSDSFDILNITNEVYDGINNGIVNPYNGTKISSITDISKHTIVVFEALDSVAAGRNDEVYTQFNYAISCLNYYISQLNNGKLPKINLIGHSRGGITNMQYALDHPDLIESIYSLGTPYTGSTTASLDFNWFGSWFAPEFGEEDIINKDVYEKYMNNWNEKYETHYSHINVMALGGYATLLNLSKGLTTETSLNYISGKTGVDKNIIKYAIPIAFGALEGIIMSKYFYQGNYIIDEILDVVIMSLSELATNFNLSYNALDDLAQVIVNELNLDYHPPFVSWYNDCLVDLGSQLGYEGLIPLDGQEYKGFKRITKAFMMNNCDFDALSMDMPAVVHNMEARDKELGTHILSDISVGLNINQEYEFSENSDGTINIDSYIGKTTETSVNIPSYINGKKVVAISDYAFANNFCGNNTIKSVTLPSSIKTIGKHAFYASSYIENIIFDESSELTTIDDYSFYMMESLNSIRIPNLVNYIGEDAFSYSSISSINTGTNTNYQWQNGFLIDKNVSDRTSYIAIYANPNITSVVVPTNVKILKAGLFQNNRNISSINLNNVQYIGSNCFANSHYKMF